MPGGIRVIQYGLGPIGCSSARYILERPGLDLVGAVDIDPNKVGLDVGEVIGLGDPMGFPVYESLTRSLAAASADVAVHTTASRFEVVDEQLTELLSAGLDVVSTAEELSYPWLSHSAAAQSLDATAKAAGRSVLGTGVNPGFLMDTLPIALSALSQRIEAIEVERVIDASQRRGPFQLKIGAGLTREEFDERVAHGQLGHVGLHESMDMLCDTLGFEMTRYEETAEHVLAESRIETGFVTVEPGQVRGLIQTARGLSGSEEFARLTFHAALGAENEGDVIRVHGRPNLEVRLTGTDGDIATAAIVVNAIPRVHAAVPGLLTMRDLPPVTAVVW